jgi:hypothetical protein
VIPGQIREHVPGSPYQPGDWVVIVQLIDVWSFDHLEVEDPEALYVGRLGRIAYLNYDCGAGQSFPGDPMMGVVFPMLRGTPRTDEFWMDEVGPARAPLAPVAGGAAPGPVVPPGQ